MNSGIAFIVLWLAVDTFFDTLGFVILTKIVQIFEGQKKEKDKENKLNQWGKAKVEE